MKTELYICSLFDSRVDTRGVTVTHRHSDLDYCTPCVCHKKRCFHVCNGLQDSVWNDVSLITAYQHCNAVQ